MTQEKKKKMQISKTKPTKPLTSLKLRKPIIPPKSSVFNAEPVELQKVSSFEYKKMDTSRQNKFRKGKYCRI